MTADELAAAVGRQAAQELTDALDRIKHCVGQLSDEQVWWRSRATMNSIGNLVLPLFKSLVRRNRKSQHVPIPLKLG